METINQIIALRTGVSQDEILLFLVPLLLLIFIYSFTLLIKIVKIWFNARKDKQFLNNNVEIDNISVDSETNE